MKDVTQEEVQKYFTEHYQYEADEVFEAQERILAMSLNVLDRRKIRKEAHDYRQELAQWRLFQIDQVAWEGFLTGLYSNGVGQRDVDSVRRTVNISLENLIAQIKVEMGYRPDGEIALYNVKECRQEIDFTTGSMTVYITMKKGYKLEVPEGHATSVSRP